MSVREFLTEHAAASGAVVVSAILLAFGAAAGCSSTVSDKDLSHGIEHPGLDAATISEARAVNLDDEIVRLKRQQDELEGKQSDCMKEAASYRAKSAGVWSDPSVAEKQRPALADQYSTLADENEAKAYRYGQIAGACASRIGLLESERRDQMHRAELYGDMIAPATDSQ